MTFSSSFGETLTVAFSKEYRSILVGGAYLCFLSNFMFYGFTYALPQIFQSLGRSISPSFEVFLISLCDYPGGALAFFFIYAKTIGHRDGLMILAACLALLSLLLISIDHGKQGLYVGLPSAYMVKFLSSSIFTLTYIYLSEVFPSKVRATALSLCIASGRVGSMISPLIFEACKDKKSKLGTHARFLIVTSLLCLLAIVVIKSTLHFELKNAPLDEAPPSITKAQDDEEDDRLPRPTLDPSMPAPAG